MSDDVELVTIEIRDGAAWLTLNQPDAGNPFTIDSVAALRDAVSAARRADVGVVVVAARGRSFSVGGDLGSAGQI